MKAIVRIGLALSLVWLATPLSAQSISFGLRGTGSFPTGDFAESSTAGNTAVIRGAKQGFGYGAELGLSMGIVGAYASFDHIAFDCETATCTSNGEYTLQGVTAGVKLSIPMMSRFRPFVKGGITYNDLKGGYGGTASSGLTTDKKAGYELGLGGDYGILGIISITPQVRYVGQNLKGKVPGVTNTASIPNSGVNYFTADLGLSVHTPFGM
jgi:opacity protein-like surface antigen